MLKVDETPVPSSAQSHLRLDWSNVCTLLLRVHLPVLETRMTNKQNKLNKRFLLRPLVLTHLPSKLCAHAPRPCSDTPSFLLNLLCAHTPRPCNSTDMHTAGKWVIGTHTQNQTGA